MRFISTALAFTLLAACSSLPVPPTAKGPEPELTTPSAQPPLSEDKNRINTAKYSVANWSELPGWENTSNESWLASWSAWQNSCLRLKNRLNYQSLCNADTLQGIAGNAEAIRHFFEDNFQPWKVEGSLSGETGLLTGYYEALLSGSRAPGNGRVPLYAEPDDLLTIELGDLFPELKGKRVRGRLLGKKVVPYFNREDINQGKGPDASKVLVWADNPIEAFFLEIQGSGRVQLEDGSMVRLGYANQNGHPYKSIGRWLADQGEIPIEEVSMQRIKAWAEAHPERLAELLSQNPSYVFFRLIPDDGRGAIGALNVPLTAEASIAVDPKFIPLGSPVWLDTLSPVDGSPLQRLVHAQDTGGAIRGPVRADFFWGFGHEAGAKAGVTKQKLKVWLLLPKNVTPPAAP